MTTDEFTSKELVTRAVDLLTKAYDSDNDSFFVVMTQGGKDDRVPNPPQFIIGELNLKSVVTFVVQVIQQLCQSMGMHPFVFISRFITGSFIDDERRALANIISQQQFVDQEEDLEDGLDDDELYDEDDDDIEVFEQEGQGDQLLDALQRFLSKKKNPQTVFYVTNHRMIDNSN